MAKVSVVISAYNEEKKIRDCLESVKWVDEIVLVDSSSTDKTPEIAKEYTSKVFTRTNNLMLNVNKNFGFTKATGDWILSLDADERVTPELKKEIEQVISDKQKVISGFWIPRKNIIFGKWIQHSVWWPDHQLRLFRKGTGKFAEKHVHEKIEIKGETEKLREPLLHYNYNTVSEFIYKMDKIYTENEVKNILAEKKSLSWVDAIRMPVNDFLKTFFLQEGYKDGLHGLVLSILQAFYMEIVFAKVWERQGFRESKLSLEEIIKELKKIAKDGQYWILTKQIAESKNSIKNLYFRLQRKLI